MSLKINEEKTKYMLFIRESNQQANWMTVGEYSFERVELFKNLGVIISSNNCEKTEINNRIGQTNKSMYA